MIVEGSDTCLSQPGRLGSGIDVAAAICVGRSLIERNDKQRMSPVRAGGYQRDKGLKKSVALGGRPVVHVVDQIRGDKGKVDRRIEVRERLNVAALGRIEPNAFKTDRRIMLSDVRPGETRTVDTACE